MKINMYKTILFALLVFSIGKTYSQNTNFEGSFIKKLNKKYDFVSVKDKVDPQFYEKCNKIVVGDYIYGPSDGGGSSVIGAKNLKFIDVDGNEVGAPTDFKLYQVNRYDHSQVLMAKYSNGLIGLLDLCGETIMEPKYAEINAFNEQGLAVTFIANEIDVIDTLGNSLLDKRINYKINYDTFNVAPKGSFYSSMKIVDGKFFQRGPNNLLAVYDVVNKKTLTDYKYDFIDLHAIEHNEVKYFKVKKGDSYNLVNIETGQELLSGNSYADIREFKRLFKDTAVEVLTNEEISNWNLVRLTDNKILFPTDIPIVSFQGSTIGETNKWVTLLHGKENGNSIFNVEVGEYVIEPKKEYKEFKFNKDFIKANTVVVKLTDDSIQLFDILNKTERKLSISGKKLDVDSIRFEDGKIWFKAFSEKRFSDFREITLYDDKWRQVYNGIAKVVLDDGLIKISESTDTESTKRPYLLQSDGEPVEAINN